MNISLPATIINDGGVPTLNLQAIAAALQKSGISVTLEKPEDEASGSGTDNSATDMAGIETPASSQASHESVSPRFFAAEPSPPQTKIYDAWPYTDTLQGQKRKSRDEDENHSALAWGRAPLKDNTAADRSNHNTRVTETPANDKGKQRAVQQETPGGSKLGNPISLHPFTPPRNLSNTAMRARALATTGQESYLTVLLSSPATSSPIKAGRITFSPSKGRTSPSKWKGISPSANTSEAVLGISSPRYSFDFSLATPSVFDTIPLEVSSASRVWNNHPTLGPPASVSEAKKSRPSPSGRSSQELGARLGYPPQTSTSMNMMDEDLDLAYPAHLSSPLDRLQRRRLSANDATKISDDEDDFDLTDFLDLDNVDGTPGSVPASPVKITPTRGFSKEFGLLSQEEVERLTSSAHSSFEEEARSSKRRKLDSPPVEIPVEV